MNALKNKVSLIGRLGANPEVLTFDSGRTLARFTLATNELFKSNNEWQETTQWHVITAWGKTAERIKKTLSKGQEIILEGRLVNQNYENKNGEKRYSTQIEMNDFYILKSLSVEKTELENKDKTPKK